METYKENYGCQSVTIGRVRSGENWNNLIENLVVGESGDVERWIRDGGGRR
jgi:hypothetical protein